MNGGGIFNQVGSTTTLSADSKDILFYSNKDNSGYNDIYQTNNSTINLNAKEGKRIIFNGTIRGDNTYNKININAVPISNKINNPSLCKTVQDILFWYKHTLKYTRIHVANK